MTKREVPTIILSEVLVNAIRKTLSKGENDDALHLVNVALSQLDISLPPYSEGVEASTFVEVVADEQADFMQRMTQASARAKQNGMRPKQGKSNIPPTPKQTISKGEATPKQEGSNTEANVKQTISNSEASIDQTSSKTEPLSLSLSNIKENIKKESAPRFSPPTLEEVTTYVQENHYSNVDPSAFLDHYTSNGWKVGKNGMKDWKAAVRNWNRTDMRGSGSAATSLRSKDITNLPPRDQEDEDACLR